MLRTPDETVGFPVMIGPTHGATISPIYPPTSYLITSRLSTFCLLFSTFAC